MRITKLSSFKEKIQKFKITDPFLTFFLKKYENLIGWEGMTCEKDISSYIHSKLLPSLFEKIDINSDNNYYVEEINLEEEYQRNSNNPQIREAWAVYQNNPEAANAMVLEKINSQKERIFSSWWNYLTKENDLYSKNPAFVYSILTPIFNISNKKNKVSSPPLNEMAIASLYNKIKETNGLQDFKVTKEYEKEANNANTKMLDFVPGTNAKKDNGWVIIPSQEKDSKNFQKNIDKLINYSIPNRWCTASGMAGPFLSKGDFYLYVVNGNAEVAIRMDGDFLAEIQGPMNRPPFKYINEIEDLLIAKKIDTKDNYHYANLMSAKKLNENLSDPIEYEKFLKQIDENPMIIDQLTQENRKIPKVSSDILEKINNKMESSDLSTQSYWELNDGVHFYNCIPKDFRNKISKKSFQRLTESVISTLNNIKIFDKKEINLDKINNLPQEILQDSRVQNKIAEVMSQMLKKSPWKIESLNEEVISSLPKETIENAQNNPVLLTIQQLKKAPTDVNPETIASEGWVEPDEDDYNWHAWRSIKPEIKEDYQEDLKLWNKNKMILEQNGIKDIREIPEVYYALLDAWQRYIAEDLTRYETEAVYNQSEYTDYYQSRDKLPPGFEDEIRYFIEREWTDKIFKDPKELEYAPEEVAYNFYEESDGDFSHVNVWLNHLLKGNWEDIDDRGAIKAMEEMDDRQLEQLTEGIIQNDINVDDLELTEDVWNRLDACLELQERKKRQKEIEETYNLQKARGQMEFPFYEEIEKKELTMPKEPTDWYNQFSEKERDIK